MNLYDLDPPQQWKAGHDSTGAFYFDCAGCEAKEPVISGFIGSGPTFNEVAAITLPNGLFKTAMYCTECWPVVKKERGHHAAAAS